MSIGGAIRGAVGGALGGAFGGPAGTLAQTAATTVDPNAGHSRNLLKCGGMSDKETEAISQMKKSGLSDIEMVKYQTQMSCTNQMMNTMTNIRQMQHDTKKSVIQNIRS